MHAQGWQKLLAAIFGDNLPQSSLGKLTIYPLPSKTLQSVTQSGHPVKAQMQIILLRWISS